MFTVISISSGVVSVLVALLVVLISYGKWALTYWKRRNIAYIEAELPFGNIKDVVKGKVHIAVVLKEIYNEMKKKNWKYGGIYMFTKPNLVITDLDLVRNIATKDFSYFADRDFYFNEKDPLQAHLLNLRGNKWKNMRSKLTPTFTSGKMKMMFNIMEECQHSLEKRMDLEVEKKEPIDIKEILACFTTNIIGSCAFGLECNALEDENSEFRQIGRAMFKSSTIRELKRTFSTTFPRIAKILNVSLSRKEIVDFTMDLINKTIDYREKNNYERNDFIQMLIKMKNSENEEERITMDELASQVIIFFAAGFETSSTLMTFTLYELAKNQKVQDRLRHEIKEVLKKHGKVSYEAIQDLTYLEQVIDESLRIHPPGALTNRICMKDYKIPNEDTIIEKGTTVTIPILGIHHDEEHYPNPEQFDPDRFSEENKRARHNYAHLPFGEGPRNCIGARFGLLQSKMGLVALLEKYQFTVNQKTQEPIVYVPKSIVLAAKGDVWLNATKVKEL